MPKLGVKKGKVLSSLIKSLPKYKVFGPKDRKVCGICDDSRKIKKEDLFVAISGKHFDAHNFIPEVISKGVAAIVGEKDFENLKIGRDATYIQVPNARYALSMLASSWYGNPSKKLRMIGVTGTDGKTTTATLIYWILKTAGKKVGLISTVSAKIGKKEYDTGFHVTNPEPLALQKFLDFMVRKGCKWAVLEVTSHGLDQDRVAGINFEASVLTNITHEHLDYHKTHENYTRAKAKLFLRSKTSVLNKDDNSFERLKKLIRKGSKVMHYDSNTLKGETKRAVGERFKEKYNQANAAASITVVRTIGISEKDIIRSIGSFPPIEGRMQEVKNNLGVRIIVDFAHTPNGLRQVLTVLREQKYGGSKLIAVFGCAGERDVGKRVMMGRISARLADTSIFTAEDPRRENVDDIIKQMERGFIMGKGKELFKIPERGKAIWFAINKLAKEGDIVVICGKGHEKSMAYNGIEYLWSDQEAVKKALNSKILLIRR